VSVVVPLFNEEATVAALYDEVRAALDPKGLAWEIIYVDDGSTDKSHQELVRLHAAHTNVRVVRLRRNFGKAVALSAGFEAAAGEVIVTMDADLQDDPAEIPLLLEKLEEGYDLVSGWKCDRRDPFARRLFSRVYNGTTGIVTGVRLHDMNCGLKIYRAEVLENVRLYGDLHRFVPVLAHHLGFRTAEIPVNHRPRLNGRSRYGLERYARGFFDLLTVAYLGRYRHRPLHFFGGIGMLLGAIGSTILLYLTVLKLSGSAIGGRPLLMLGILLVVVGIQFFSLGLVGEMLTSNHAEKAAATSTGRAHVRDSLR
jgi:glycosyltransferase involved in cell wall biosynthesis